MGPIGILKCGAVRKGVWGWQRRTWSGIRRAVSSESGSSRLSVWPEVWQHCRWLYSWVITGGGFVLGFTCCSSLPDAVGRAGCSGQWDSPAAG